jgi:hypothetical protein
MIRRSSSQALCALLSVALASGAVAQPQQPPPATTPVAEADRPHFAWPAGTVATIETDYRRDGGVDPAPPMSRLRLSHRMRVTPHSEGLLIEYDDQRHLASSGDFVQASTALLQMWIPGTVVTSEGAFVRVEGVQRVQELAAAAYAQSPLAEQVPAFKQFASRMVSGNGLSQQQELEWHYLVGEWAGKPFSDTPVETDGRVFVGPGVSVPTKMTVAIVGREPCTRGPQVVECFTYEWRRNTDVDALNAAMKGRTAGTNLPPSRALEMVEVLRVTSETATMLPHALTLTRTRRGRVELNGKEEPTTDFEQRTMTFTYQPN